GNPPYVLMQDDFRDDAQLDYFRRHYQGASYKLDTYHLFIERGLGLTRPGGRLSFITPSNFIANNHLDGLRRVILGRSQPEGIVVIDGGVFDGASVDCAVLVLRVGEAATDPFEFSRATADPAGLRPMRSDRVFPDKALADKRALFTAGMVNAQSTLWDALTARFKRLGDVADVNFGKQLRDRSRFPMDVIEVDGPGAIPPTHVACVTGRDVERYELKWSGLACLDDTEAQRGGCWDEAKHRASGKLLTRQIGRHPTFALDVVGYHCLNTVFMVTPRAGSGLSPSYLLGLLNSDVIRSLWLGRFYDQRTTFPKIKGSYLKELPIPLGNLAEPADRARHDALVALVEKMLALVPRLRTARGEIERATLRNAVTATEQQINAAVHGLFGLGPEDVAVVEAGATAG
ncbi:MAG: TaqI-like C-terminal specificity domain-containing protein, partial [Verrucomicrobiota bacterium]